jgi:hypothetical protein
VLGLLTGQSFALGQFQLPQYFALAEKSKADRWKIETHWQPPFRAFKKYCLEASFAYYFGNAHGIHLD